LLRTRRQRRGNRRAAEKRYEFAPIHLNDVPQPIKRQQRLAGYQTDAD
jgi:hypothetical protein